MDFSLFWNTVSIAIISLQGTHKEHVQAPKTNNTLNFNNFSGTWPILDLKVSLDTACQGLKLYLKVEALRGDWVTLEPVFEIYVKFSIFYGI